MNSPASPSPNADAEGLGLSPGSSSNADAATAKEPLPQGWQPIETAPKDGTSVLMAPHMMTGWWDFGDDTWLLFHVPLNEDRTIADDWKANVKMFFCVSADVGGVEPTHWMPLPAPPQ